jgi:hypothetical protein
MLWRCTRSIGVGPNAPKEHAASKTLAADRIRCGAGQLFLPRPLGRSTALSFAFIMRSSRQCSPFISATSLDERAILVPTQGDLNAELRQVLLEIVRSPLSRLRVDGVRDAGEIRLHAGRRARTLLPSTTSGKCSVRSGDVRFSRATTYGCSALLRDVWRSAAAVTSRLLQRFGRTRRGSPISMSAQNAKSTPSAGRRVRLNALRTASRTSSARAARY